MLAIAPGPANATGRSPLEKAAKPRLKPGAIPGVIPEAIPGAKTAPTDTEADPVSLRMASRLPGRQRAKTPESMPAKPVPKWGETSALTVPAPVQQNARH